jgi:hypothetical protein
MERRLTDITPTRRDVLKWGGAALAGTWIERVTWPLQVHAAGKANPRGTARNCIFVELGGCISPMECWDLKQTDQTPKDLDPQKLSSDLYLSKTLFPTLINHMDKVALVRSMRASELIHFQGQYHTQAGRALNPAIAKERPGFGSVISAELEARRRDTDRFPTYVSTSLTRARAGSIGAGFFPAKFTGLDLDPLTVFEAFSGNTEGVNRVLEERWNMLGDIAEASLAERAAIGTVTSDYRAYYREAYGLLNDSRWSKVFNATEEEKKRYGADEYGMGLILARNLIAADGGTRFVYVYDGDRWDHHSYIFDHSKANNHYVTCARFDKGMTALFDDLLKMPGKEPGKSLFDETLIVCTSEFGRTPYFNPVAGRDHHRLAYTAFFAGGGVKGGRIVGKTDEYGKECVETGWSHKQQPKMDNTVATIYSALGIDWKKVVTNTPSHRAYEYTQIAPLSGGEFISDDEIAEIFV